MISRKYFGIALLGALLPLFYFIRIADVSNWWSVTNDAKIERLYVKMSQKNNENVIIKKIYPAKNMTISLDHIPIGQVYNKENLTITGKPPLKKVPPDHIPIVQVYNKDNLTITGKPPLKKVPPVPQLNYTLRLGPTSPYYNATPPSDQVGQNLINGITVVSLYFKLPPFPKGSVHIIRSPSSYMKWMKVFRFILNPVIVYTDNNGTYTLLTNLFESMNKTSYKVIMIQRKDLWSFQQMPVVEKIFKQKNYPVHYPNTVIPAYNCMTHAKFEVLRTSIEKNYFKTKYFMWLDIGYFRYEITKPFGLDLPSTFDERRIGITSCGRLVQNVSIEKAVRGNKNWIAGGCLLGRFDVLRTFCDEYIAFVKRGIKEKMLGVEQQMMYAMFSDKDKPKTSIQLCSPGWFCMGRIAVEAWWKKHKSVS